MMDDGTTDGTMLDEAMADAEGRWQHLVEHIHDAVVAFELIDSEPVIREVNRAFVERFGYDRTAVVGESLNAYIVPEWLAEEASSLDSKTADGEINYRRVQRQTATGLKEFLYRGIPTDEDGPIDGFAVYTDLTEIVQQERRLEVLNRILRHNLRNRATTIAGNTSRLLAQIDEQTAESTRAAATIEQEAEALRKLAEEATRIQQLTEFDGGDRSSFDCIPLLRGCLEECRRQYPNAEIRSDLPPTMEIHATRDLRIAVESLLENAVEHNPASKPRVSVRAERGTTDGWIDIYVEDDGPKISGVQRQIITGEAEITPLRHGKGIGLWLVKWATERFGGELSFETSEWGGNSVHLRVPSTE